MHACVILVWLLRLLHVVSILTFSSSGLETAAHDQFIIVARFDSCFFKVTGKMCVKTCKQKAEVESVCIYLCVKNHLLLPILLGLMNKNETVNHLFLRNNFSPFYYFAWMQKKRQYFFFETHFCALFAFEKWNGGRCTEWVSGREGLSEFEFRIFGIF